MHGVVGSFTFTGKGSTMNPLESFMNGLDLGKKISPILETKLRLLQEYKATIETKG